jgi:phosphatidate phosphatase PAH1
MSAVDVVAVKHRDGTIRISPFYLRLVKPAKVNKFVSINMNGNEIKTNTTFEIHKGDRYATFDVKEEYQQYGVWPIPSKYITHELLAPFKYDATQQFNPCIPPPHVVEQLSLHEGLNDMIFTVEGEPEPIEAKIYVFNETDKLVISDFDGTITTTTLMGHLFLHLGMSYTHPGISDLFTEVANRGYKFLYLTRNNVTNLAKIRTYIQKVRQSDASMPCGSILTMPQPTFITAVRMMLLRHKFKERTLASIKALFPDDANPLYAGFGDKKLDMKAYIGAGIDDKRSFRVHHRKVGTHKSYTHMHKVVDEYFPPIQ